MQAEGVSTATLHTLNDASFEAELRAATRPTLVCFLAPSDVVSEIWLQEVESRFSGRLRVILSPLSESPVAAMRHGVVLTPAYMMFEAGKKRGLAVGAMNPDDLTRFVNRVLN